MRTELCGMSIENKNFLTSPLILCYITIYQLLNLFCILYNVPYSIQIWFLEVFLGFLRYKLEATWARTVAYILQGYRLNHFFLFLGGSHSFPHLEQALMSGQEHSMISSAYKEKHFGAMELISSTSSKANRTPTKMSDYI